MSDVTSIEARLVGIEVRLTGLEGRMSQLAAGQTGHELAIMRIADTQAEHTATLARIEAAIAAIAARLP